MQLGCDIELISVGNELLLGNTVNTNASWIASHITSSFFSVKRLASVINAISLTRGDSSIIDTLSSARDRVYAERKELERLAEEAYSREVLALAESARSQLVTGGSILKDRADGSEDILRDAFEDGSSVVCQRCSALVKASRWQNHATMWCSELDEGM